MTTVRSFLVVLIASATGVVLGRGAGAFVHPLGAGVAAVPVAAVSPPERPSAKAGDTLSVGAGASAPREDGEPDEPRPDATGENPYEEAPAHPAPARVQLPMRDGML